MIASKHVLVIDQQERLGADIERNLEASNQPVLAPSAQDLLLDDLSAVQDYFDSHRPALVIHRPPALVHLGRTGYFSQLENIVAACAMQGSMLLHLSDYHVFGGENKNHYSENDNPSPLDHYGGERVRWENCIRQSIDKHIILRHSWLIEADGENLFTGILKALVSEETLSLSKHRLGAPTWSNDVVRVICGVARQMLAGADNWGNFHYCSSDACSEWDFGQQLLESVSEMRLVNGKLVPAENESESRAPADSSAPMEPTSAVLSCRRVLNNFGVHGRTWRQGLKAQIHNWLDHHGG